MIECAGKDLGLVNDVCVHGNHGPYKHSPRRKQRRKQEGGMPWCAKQEQCPHDAVSTREAVLRLHIAQMSVEALWSPTTPQWVVVQLQKSTHAAVVGAWLIYLQKACWSSACW